jgi:hypothetical protein
MHPHYSSGTGHVSRQSTSSNAGSHGTGEKLKIKKNVAQIFFTFIHNSLSRCRHVHVHVLYDKMCFKKTYAAAMAAEKFHCILFF